MTWDVFASSVRNFQRGFMGEPKEVRPGRGGFHENPSTCICEDSTAKVEKNSGSRKHGKDSTTKRNASNDEPDVDNEAEWPEMDDDDDDQNDLADKGTFNETFSDYDAMNFEDPDLEEIISD